MRITNHDGDGLSEFSNHFPSFALRFFFPNLQDGLDCAAHSGKGRGYEAPDSMRDRNQMARELSLICFVSRSTVTQYWFGFYLVGCFVSHSSSIGLDFIWLGVHI
jgi:hypothetical protein